MTRLSKVQADRANVLDQRLFGGHILRRPQHFTHLGLPCLFRVFDMCDERSRDFAALMT
ncbi:MAG: hypothetical protein ABIT23_01170 [Nitrosospira sp.]